jgi:hypothetical protein
MTAAEWRKARPFLKDRFDNDRRLIRHVIRMADALGIPDDVVLLPRLQALSAAQSRARSLGWNRLAGHV